MTDNLTPVVLVNLDSRNRVSLSSITKLHDRYVIAESPDGTLVLTPVNIVKADLT